MAVSAKKYKTSEQAHHGLLRRRKRKAQGLTLAQGLLDFLISLVLAKSVYRPNRGRDPSDKGQLQDQANNTRHWTTNREKS
jgi:hypothetical protein